ncbi:NB-ARC domain-containing protein [Actinoplanes sp. NPDC000266]
MPENADGDSESTGAVPPEHLSPGPEALIAESSGIQVGDHNTQTNIGPVQGDFVQVAGDYTVQHFGPAVADRADMAPALPSGTVRRDELSRAVIDLLQRSGPARVALVGSGGLGKTTTAAAMCREEAVISRYPAGVVWIQVGQGRSGAALARVISQATYRLTGRQAAIIDPDQAVQQLARSLAADSLVVVDDVWTVDQLTPFRFLGDHGCLATTRNQTSLPSAFSPVPVGEMSDAEARALLTARAGLLTDDDVTALFEATGRWPLLLALVSGMLARYLTPGQGVVRYLAAIRQHTLSARNAAGAVLDTSLSFLEAERGRQVLDRYLELAIFSSRDPVPVDVVAGLWQVPTTEAVDLCLLFAELSLVDEFGFDPPRVRLHEVVRDFLIVRTGEATVRESHARLLAAVRRRAAQWWLLDAHESYLWNHLRDHFLGAGRDADWAALVTSPAWVAAKLEAVGVVALYADLDDPAVPAARPLLRAVGQSRHLLIEARSPGALTATLLSRLVGRRELASLATGLRETLSAPALLAAHPLPDRPEPSLRNVFVSADGMPIRTVAAGTRADEITGVAEGVADTVLVWNLSTGRLTTQYEFDGDVIDGGARPGSRWLVLGSETTILVWDVDQLEVRSRIPAGSRTELSCAMPDHLEWILFGATSGDLWAVAPDHPDQPVAEAPPAQAGVVGCAATPDGRYGLALRKDGSVTVWAVHENTFVTVDPPADFDGTADHIVVSGETAVVSTDSRERAIYFLDVRGGEWLGSLEGMVVQHGDQPISRDGRLLVTVERGLEVLTVWDIAQPRRPVLRHRLTLHDDMVTACVFSPDGSALGVGYQGGEAFVVDLTGEARATRLTRHQWPVVGICFSPDGSWLATSEFGPGPVRVHTNGMPTGDEPARPPAYTDPATGRPMPAARGVWLADPETWDFVHKNAGRNRDVDRCAAGSRQSWLITYGTPTVTWNVTTGRAIRMSEPKFVATYRYDVTTAMSETDPDRPMVAESAKHGPIVFTEVWDPRTGETLYRLPTYQNETVAVGGGVSGAASWVVTTEDTVAGKLAVWDLAAGRRLYTLHSYRADRDSVRPALNDTALVAISGQGDLDVVDVASGVIRRMPREPADARCTSVVIADDSHMAFALTEDGRVSLIDLSKGVTIARRGSGIRSGRLLHGDVGEGYVVIRGDSAVVRLDLLGGRTVEIDTSAGRCLAVSPQLGLLCSVHRSGESRFSTVLVHETASGALLAELHVEGNVDQCAWVGGSSLICLVGDHGIYLLRLGEGPLPEAGGDPSEAELAAQHALIVSSMNLRGKGPAYASLALRAAERSGDLAALARAWDVMGLCLVEVGDHARAAEAFRRSRELSQGSENDDVAGTLLSLARSLAAESDVTSALTYAMEAWEMARRTGHLGGVAARAAATYALAAGRPADAAGILRAASGDGRVDETVRCLRLLIESDLPAALAARPREIARLADAYEELGEAANRRWALRRLGDARLRRGRYGGAALAYVRARGIPAEGEADDEAPIDDILRRHLGEVIEYVGRKGTPGELGEMLDLGATALLKDGDVSGAEAALNRAPGIPAALASVRLAVGRGLVAAGLFERALTVLSGVRLSGAADVLSLAERDRLLGLAYRGIGQSADAARAFERSAGLLRPEGHSAEGLMLLEAARTYSGTGDWNAAGHALGEALRSLRQARDQYPDDGHWPERVEEALLLLSSVATSSGDRRLLDLAAAELTAAVLDTVRVNRSGPLIIAVASLAEKRGRLPEAIGYYRKWLESGGAGDEAFVWWSVSSLSFRIGDFGESAEAGLRSARIYARQGQPRNARLGLLLAGQSLYAMERYAEAVPVLEQCRALYSSEDDDPKEVGGVLHWLYRARVKAFFRRHHR